MPVHQIHILPNMSPCDCDNVFTIIKLTSSVIVTLEVGKTDPDGVALRDLDVLVKFDWARI